MTDNSAPKKPTTQRKKPAPRRTNPLENLQLKSSKRGSIQPPERYINVEAPVSTRKRAAVPKKAAAASKKKPVEKKKVEKKKPTVPKKTTTKKTAVKKNVSPAVAVSTSA